jgi:hypothetical protein
MHKTGSMKYLILSLFLLIGNVIRSQNDSPLKKVGDFVLGMNETEFLKIAESKYNVYPSRQGNITYNTNKLAKTADHNITYIRYNVSDFNFLVSKTNFDRATFVFINSRLIEIDLKKAGPLKAKEGEAIIENLRKTYMKGAAHIAQKKPDKKGNTEYEKYAGNLQIYSHKPQGIRAKQGYTMEFFFTSIKKSTDYTEIRFCDIDDSRFWDKYISMGIELKAKGIEPYREFRGAYLGMYLEYFKNEFSEVKKAENPGHADIPKYNNCDVYTCEIENPEIDGINIENIYYYFYKNRLLGIQCSINQNITREEEDLFIENLKTAYGEYTQLNKDDKVSPEWIYKSVGFEIRMMYKREIKSLVFSFESLGDALINKN